MPPARPSPNGRVLVVTPTYNEIESLEPTVSAVLREAPEVDILVVDDASPDGTGALADRLAADEPRVTVLHRDRKDGLGRAYVAGFAVAAERGYDIVVELDADGSHPADALPALLAALGPADAAGTAAGIGLVIGSRWVPGGRVVDWPAPRRWLSRGGNWYARTMLRLPVRDVTAGYRAWRMEALRDIPLAELESRGYCFQIDMTRACRRRRVGRRRGADHLHRTPGRPIEDEPGDRGRGDVARHGLGGAPDAAATRADPRRERGFCRHPPTGSPGEWSIG